MGRIITGRKIWQNGTFGVCDIAIQCDDILGNPKLGWVTRKQGCCGGGLEYNLVTVDPDDDNALSGVIVDLKSQGQVLLDVATVDEVVSACNDCCDTVDGYKLTPVYDDEGEIAIPDFEYSSDSVFCITRDDNGGAQAVQKFNMDYSDKVNTVQHISYADGTSTYRVTASAQPVPIGTDTVEAGECGA